MYPAVNAYSFLMKEKRPLTTFDAAPVPPPKEHIRVSPLSSDIEYELFGLDDYTQYTKNWFIAFRQPAMAEFLKQQRDFIKHLTFREYEILRTYTFFGDKFLNRFLRQNEENIHELIVEYMLINDVETPIDYQIYDSYDELKRKGVVMPVAKEELIAPDGTLIREYCKRIVRDNSDWFGTFKHIKPLIYDLFVEFMEILLRAPRPTAPITVYRGVVSEHQTSLEFTSLDFWSTSVNPYHTFEFTKTDEFGIECCVYEIVIHPNIPCLFLDPISKVVDEMEILLPPSVFYKSASEVRQKLKYTPELPAFEKSIYTVHLEAISFTTDSLSYELLEKRWGEERARREKRRRRTLKYTATGVRNPKSLQTRKTARGDAGVEYTESMPAGYRTGRSHKKRSTYRRNRPGINTEMNEMLPENI